MDELKMATAAEGDYDNTALTCWANGQLVGFVIHDEEVADEDKTHVPVFLSRAQLAALGAWIAAVTSEK